jgi:hypothetical protein
MMGNIHYIYVSHTSDLMCFMWVILGHLITCFVARKSVEYTWIVPFG